METVALDYVGQVVGGVWFWPLGFGGKNIS
jgi:hypothetical protein